jgi:aspartyl-tRNA(Asn)/glutamyl-tRNA(Gln) amidotransferase subunit C
MAEITKQDVLRVAKLARIELSEKEIESLPAELSKIMNMVSQLQEVNTDNVAQMTSVTEMSLSLREDKVTDGNCVEQVLANSPVKEFKDLNCFVVPKVVE